MKLTKEQIKEINARVEFKMKDVKSWLRNQIGLKWQQAFQSGDQKYEWYMNALKDIEREIDKEVNMPLPKEILTDENSFKELRNEYVDKFVRLFRLEGTPEYRNNINSIVSLVEELIIKS